METVIQKTFNAHNELLSTAELIRIQANNQLDPNQQKEFSQYFTPLSVARYMASLFSINKTKLNILDPGAGIGILSAALIDRIIKNDKSVRKINLTLFETDETLIPQLEQTLNLCELKCEQSGFELEFFINNTDFIEAGTESVKTEIQLFTITDFMTRFDLIIMNPPYKKILSSSKTRQLLRSINIEASNMYSAFLAMGIELLKEKGQLVAITPRSFTNGPYFKAFRNLFFNEMSFANIHVFNSRNKSFNDDGVLQENIIFRAYKKEKLDKVLISSSDDPTDEIYTQIGVSHKDVLNPKDKNKIIHLITDKNSENVIKRIRSLPCNLADLDIDASTGRVVDFRATEFLSQQPVDNTVPLIYSHNFNDGYITWPVSHKKPNSIIHNEKSDELLIENGFYVVCRRFSAKEEKRRIVAALFNPNFFSSSKIGFENHINVFHYNLKGLNEEAARGLTLFLNSTIIDLYFRIFNGHTQVNAADLRMLRYPSKDQLINLSKYFTDIFPSQDEIDNIIEKELFSMAKEINPVKIDKKIKQTISLLKDLGIPKQQLNERSALTLLALLDLKPNQSWKKASDTLLGITEMMNFFSDNYGKTYAPNSRETVRRYTVHQFVQAGLVIPNPDKPRPINSPQYVYQIEPSALKLIREYSSKTWKKSLKTFLSTIETLKDIYAQERDMARIPVNLSGKEIQLSPGGQNVLVKIIIDDFCSRFTPDAEPLYIGDTEKKWAYFNENAFKNIGIILSDEHGKMPDLIIHYTQKNWLVLIEAVTSHGPINAKRKIELEEIFKDSKVGLVFITAFLDRKTMLQYLNDIAWETEVWVAESPTHLIHFNGKRFLGPYVK